MEGKPSRTIPGAEAFDFNQLVTAHHGRVYRAIRNLVHDPAEAEDLTQETFLKAYRGLPGYRGEAGVKTWLLRIARNVVRDSYRHGARRNRGRTLAADDLASAAHVADVETPTPAEAAERHLSGKCVRECVGSLPAPHREVVELRGVLGLTSPEIAIRLGISLDAVKMRVHRAWEQLRTTFERHCEVYRDGGNEFGCRPLAPCVPQGQAPLGGKRAV